MSFPIRAVESFAGTDLNTMSGSSPRLTFWIESGLDDGLAVRGTDTVVPGATGRTARDRKADRRLITVFGIIAGVGSTAAAQTDDFRDAMQVITALFNPTTAPASLVVAFEDGVRSATISARALPDPDIVYVGDVLAEVAYDMEAISPTWAITP